MEDQQMTPEELEAMPYKQLLVRLAMDTAVLKDRTAELPHLYERVSKTETNITWLKRTMYGAVPTTAAILTLIGMLMRLLKL